MPTIQLSDFAAFFHELYGCGPFPWQQRLADRVARGPWPQAIALPTAAGKTACIDIAIFALACQADRDPAERTAPRRIFFVVDRRVVVDEAFRRARRLADGLANAKAGILRRVAEALRSLGGEDRPLACFQLRGGMYLDDAWARTPCQPTVIASTVDQVGSRLLCRSYGSGEYSWPIHAGLAANDSLVILDEAHCAQPFRHTAEAVARYRTWAERPLLSPFQVVVMSATPPLDVALFEADKADRDHPDLGRRLRAPKPGKLVVAKKAKGEDADAEFAAELARQALKLADANPTVAVMLNRVATARLTAQDLQDAGRGDVVLLTGRMRPIDRDRLLARWENVLKAGADRAAMAQPVFVVATQCLEVGADFDFDALVTECAPLDSLRQRFGRLNRLGRRDSAPACVVIRPDQAKSTDDDPVYGAALAATWKWLKAHADGSVIDMGVQALAATLQDTPPDQLAALLAPAADAPIMLPAHLDAWAQTHPEPVPTPDVAVFLHGPAERPTDVHVIWRSDLDPDGDGGVWIDTLSLCPPTLAEAMPVRIAGLRAWLAGQGDPSALDASDLEAERYAGEPSLEAATPRRVVRWRGPDQSEVIDRPADICPGDTVVMLAAYGGWNKLGSVPPDADEPGRIDVGDAASLQAKARPVLRIHPLTTQAWPDCPARAALLDIAAQDDLPEDGRELECLLQELAASPGCPNWLSKAAGALAGDGRHRRMARHPAGAGLVLWSNRRLPTEDPTEESAEDDSTSRSGVAVALSDHSGGARDLARCFAARCGLAGALAGDIALAAWLHDVGKADPRFQLWLHNGSELAAAAAGRILAKSEQIAPSAQAQRQARLRSGYPQGARHELLSVRLAESHPDILRGAHDRELILHLIASHHGRCRPFAPVVFDERPVEVRLRHDGHELLARSDTGLERLDSGVAERFWRLVRRYGWFGLAYLEAILRLADRRQSEREQGERELRAGT